MGERNTKLHIVFDADVTPDGVLLESHREKVLEFPDKPSAWTYLFCKERGRSYERLIPAGVTDSGPDIYALRRY